MRRYMPLLAAAALALSTTAGYADLGDQLFKLLPDDGAADDLFSMSVMVSGTTAIVGAHLDDDNGFASGSAYLFDTTTGAQIAKLLPNDGASMDRFGRSVAISGATAIAGAHTDVNNPGGSGSAYLFDASTGRQITRLLPNDGELADSFGYSVAISGTIAVVGAFQDDDNGNSSGSAYLFDTIAGRQIAKLLPDDGAAEDRFGRVVAISGATAIVGARFDSDNGQHSGSAYLFDTTTGQQIDKLLPSDGAAGDQFGTPVAISGTTAIVGANHNNDNGQLSGSAYLFDTTTGGQIAKLLPNDGEAGEVFGWSVGISATVAIVGAIGDGAFSGSAYLFNATTGQQIAKILPDDGAEEERFGYSVSISGTTAIVGAVWDDDNGQHSGSAYLFDAAACPGDFDDDGVVGASDLAELLGAWGPNPDHAADLDGDGDVDAADLAQLLGNWGPCP